MSRLIQHRSVEKSSGACTVSQCCELTKNENRRRVQSCEIRPFDCQQGNIYYMSLTHGRFSCLTRHVRLLYESRLIRIHEGLQR